MVVARLDGVAVGCGGYRPLTHQIAEASMEHDLPAALG
jgi:hypothetical protein